jgi:trimeric autotransporter adhesin
LVSRILTVLAKWTFKEICMKPIAIIGTVALVLFPSVVNATPFQTFETTQATSVSANAGAASHESVPRLVQFNGTLKDSAARPVSGVASVTFAIYAEQDGGATLWTETQNVLADSNGHFTALLGTASSGGFPSELIGTGQSRWLGVTIARQQEMPRVLLASVPYALKAGDADTLGGLPASSYVTTQQLAASNARPATSLLSGGGTTIVATSGVAASGVAAGPIAEGASQSNVIQANPTGGGTTDFIPLWSSGSNLSNSLLFQTGGKVGIGTTTPASTLDINGGEVLRGGFYEYAQGTATTAAGQPSHSFQWDASVFDSSAGTAVNKAFGFRAVPQNNNTSNPGASLDLFYGTGGPTGTLNDLGLSINTAGVITFVSGQKFSGGEVNLPNTTSATNGVISIGGTPFLGDLGSPTNTFVGGAAGGTAESSGNAINNTGLGSSALSHNTVGFNNTAVGSDTLVATTSGSYNTAIGEQALEFTTTGGSNVAIGYFAGNGNTTGGSNVFIGSNAGANVGNLNNAVAIGSGATVSESGAIVLGGINPNASNVGIGTSAPGYSLEVDDHGSGKAGIAALSDIPGDNAIIGEQGATNGGSNGAYFSTNDPAGTGVVGVNFAAGGKAGYFAGGVYVTGNLEVQGTVQVDGNLIKPAGSFKIDDPIAPGEKYLSHSFVESPDMMNIYNGNVVTDAKGFATVRMPAWFEALNGDFRYQLTTVGTFSQAMIAQEITGGKFRIRTSKPHVKVSWQVTGVRHDAWANAHRIPTEEVKPDNEQGHYLHPELFGADADKAITTAAISAASGTQASATHAKAKGLEAGKR